MNQPQNAAANAPTIEIDGRPVRLPVIVRDATAGTALFLVPSAAAQALLPGDAFAVVEAAPGLTQLAIGFVDYRDNDLGDYDEAMIVFFVRPKNEPTASEGTFIYALPVNQPFTCEAGIRIWGFPKSLADISISYEAQAARCRLVMDGKLVFELELPRVIVTDDADEMAMVTYSYTDAPMATEFHQGGGIGFGDPSAVQLKLGDHPLARALATLGLPSTPLIATWTEHMRGSFAAPEALA